MMAAMPVLRAKHLSEKSSLVCVQEAQC
jgi:hypothetical protein